MIQVEPALLDRCIRKDSSAQFELYKHLRDTLLSVAYRYERDPQHRQAMVNTAFLKILDHLQQRDPRAPFEAWCRRIMINTVLNDLRDRRTAQGPEVSMEAEVADAHRGRELNGCEELFEAEELQHMLDQLPAVTRQVFNLYAIDGWKHREIAEQLGMSEGTSKWHVNHARERLRGMLEKGVRSHLNLRIA